MCLVLLSALSHLILQTRVYDYTEEEPVVNKKMMRFELGSADYKTLHRSSTLDSFKGMGVVQGPDVGVGIFYGNKRTQVLV